MIEKQTRDNKIEISKLAKETIKLSADIEDVGEALGEVQTAVTTATSGIAALEAATTALTEQTNTVEANVSALTQQTTALETQTSSLQIANVGINERLGVVENDLTTQNSTLANHASEIYAHESRITALENNSGSTGGGDTGSSVAGAIDNFGKKYTTLEELSALINDCDTETHFSDHSLAKFPVCLLLTGGTSTDVLFRINPLQTKKAHIRLKLWFANPNGELPTEFKLSANLNKLSLFSNTVLQITNKIAELEFDIDFSTRPNTVFNTLNLIFDASNNMDGMFLDWIEFEISNAYNPIVLNRNTDFEIYGVKRNSGEYRIFSSKYAENGTWGFIGGDSPTIENDDTIIQSHKGTAIQGSLIKWASRTPQQRFNTNFTVTTYYHLDYFITQDNKLYANFSSKPFTEIESIGRYLENVRYAKKSLHNGSDEEPEFACAALLDFSVSLVRTYYPGYTYHNFFYSVPFNFNGEDYPKEFVDFIPVYDHNILANKTQKLSCGYFLHHQSGNIIFVPERSSSYFIKIGKGRQVHAFLSIDSLKISVFFQLDDKVVQKTLVRETIDSEWKMTNHIQYFHDIEDVVPFQDFYYTVYNRDIKKFDGGLI